MIKGDAPAKAKLDAYGIDTVCDLIANCEPLHKIAHAAGVSKGTLIVWLDAYPDHYARAKSAQADRFTEEMLAIADEPCTVLAIPVSEGDPIIESVDSAAVNRNRLRVDTRKWLASKFGPKRYADKIIHAGDAENPLQVKLIADAADLTAKIKGQDSK